jgi:hypothetical protein
MPDENPFTLRQVDLARADFAAIESDLEFIKSQIARLPTRRDLARSALMGLLAGSMLTTLFVLAFLR